MFINRYGLLFNVIKGDKMRSFLVIIFLPFVAFAGETTESSVMTAACQCEIQNGDSLFEDARNQDVMLGMIPTMSPYFFAQGEYELKSNASTFNQHAGMDPSCEALGEDNLATWQCLNAVVWAKRRAEGDCARKAIDNYSTDFGSGLGLLVPQSCNYQLNGENIELPESLIPFS